MNLKEKAKHLSQKYRTLLKNHSIDTNLEKAHFFAQWIVESNLIPVSENLNYSAKRLLQVFPKYFTPESAKSYAGNPEKIANRVYGNRMGNGPESSGDGYKYRGRGFLQLTGKRNYEKLSSATGVDYVNNPDLLLTEADSMVAACWYWKTNNIGHWANQDNVNKVTRLINGGTHGLTERQKWTTILKNEFKSKS